MKYIMVVLTLILLGLQALAGKITDDFEDGDLRGWRRTQTAGGERAEWIVKNGELVFTSENFCRETAAFGTGDKTWTDYEFSVDFSLKETFPTGLGCWFPALGITIQSDMAETGTMKLDRVQYVAVYSVNLQPDRGNDGWSQKGCGVRMALTPPGPYNLDDFVTKPRKWYTLRLSSNTEGDNNQDSVTTYQASINNKVICDFSFPTPFLGGERINVGGVAITIRNAEVHFDNVVIAGESIPDMDVNDFVGAWSVSRGGKLATTWGEIKQHR